MKLVVLLSGGMDSTTLATVFSSSPEVEVRALGFNYGQRHAKELDAAAAVASHLGIPFQVVDLSSLQPVLSGSSLTSPEVEVPEGHYTDESMKATVVSNRNSIMANVAMGYALSIGFDGIALAVHAGDHAIYPDCRPEFVTALQHFGKFIAERPVAVLAPFLLLTKAKIATIAGSRGAPLHLTWSCYKGGEKHCGKCGTCVERKEAFQLAGIPDPTAYE